MSSVRSSPARCARSASPADGRDQQRPRAAPRQLQHPLPDGRPGQVHADHPGAPAQQHRQRAHLGTRPEHHDRPAGQGQPVRVRRDRPHRVRARRFDDAVGHPRLEPAQQRTAAQPLIAVRHRQLAFGRPGARHRGRRQLAPRGRGHQRVEPGFLAVAADDPHPPVQRLQPVAGHRHRGLPGGQPRLDEPAEVRQVTGAPVALPLRGAGARRHRPGAAHRRPPPGPAPRCSAARRPTRERPPRPARRRSFRSRRHQTIMANLSCLDHRRRQTGPAGRATLRSG